MYLHIHIQNYDKYIKYTVIVIMCYFMYINMHIAEKEVVDLPTLENFKTCVGKTLSNLV